MVTILVAADSLAESGNWRQYSPSWAKHHGHAAAALVIS